MSETPAGGEESADDDRPDWWLRNQSLKHEHGLPEYEPPRFEDDTYVHEVVPDLESAHDCTIRFLGIGTTYPEDWEVRANHTSVLTIGRHRDRNGNTVYEMTAATFRECFETAVEDADAYEGG